MIVQFYGVTFDMPTGWEDITDNLPAGSPPTLAKASGVGAVQFSIATYHSGKNPNVNFNDLRSFMIEFCQNNSIDSKDISSAKNNNIMCVGLASKTEDETLSAWYLSNGKDVVFVTYVASSEDAGRINKELTEAKTMISSMSF
ncbi:hypothetical protein NKH57_21900 [Mesorhizobium sp. M1050]|uniref:hypothetical protein n=1 Tax=Mesorhizobium sp. M1050 TaxID=2957051 RepID=UPI00333C6FBC